MATVKGRNRHGRAAVRCQLLKESHTNVTYLGRQHLVSHFHSNVSLQKQLLPLGLTSAIVQEPSAVPGTRQVCAPYS